MDKKKIIEMLNTDIEGEHAAIIQYLLHAYAMGEGEISCEIEAIAREEMRHLDFLAETIVELGGTPTLNRGMMRMWGRLVPDWMNNDILQEDDAIKLYKEHIKTIDDPKIKRLLERILSDEESHRGSFVHFVDKSRREKATDHRGDKQDETSRVLNWGIEHEYTVILQYMLQSYLTPNAEAGRELEDQAINEMQHLGWLAEELVSGGGRPRIEHTVVDQSQKTADMLRADIKIEKEVAEAYDKAARKIEDPGLKTLLERIRDHEIYHTKVFGDLLNEEEK
jgi:bacterioferritin